MPEYIILRCTACRTLNRLPANKLWDRPVCGKCRKHLEFPKAPVTATASTLDHEINDWPMALLVELKTAWCGHCRRIEPAVADLAARRAGFLKVIQIDVDIEREVSNRFSIKGTPTFLLYQNGRMLARLDGAPKDQRELENWVAQTLKK